MKEENVYLFFNIGTNHSPIWERFSERISAYSKDDCFCNEFSLLKGCDDYEGILNIVNNKKDDDFEMLFVFSDYEIKENSFAAWKANSDFLVESAKIGEIKIITKTKKENIVSGFTEVIDKKMVFWSMN